MSSNVCPFCRHRDRHSKNCAYQGLSSMDVAAAQARAAAEREATRIKFEEAEAKGLSVFPV